MVGPAVAGVRVRPSLRVRGFVIRSRFQQGPSLRTPKPGVVECLVDRKTFAMLTYLFGKANQNAIVIFFFQQTSMAACADDGAKPMSMTTRVESHEFPFTSDSLTFTVAQPHEHHARRFWKFQREGMTSNKRSSKLPSGPPPEEPQRAAYAGATTLHLQSKPQAQLPAAGPPPNPHLKKISGEKSKAFVR